MQKLFSSYLGDISDGSFSQTVLEVGIDNTVGESLLPLGAMVDECIVGKVAIVDMVVFNGDKMGHRKLFKSLLFLDCFIAGHAVHHVDVAEA